MHKTLVDWWAYRAKCEPAEHQLALREIFGPLGEQVRLERRRGGYLGYQHSAVVKVGDLDAGLVAWGGESQRGWSLVSLNGSGCSWVDDWDQAQDVAQDLAAYQVRRVDIALDTFDRDQGYAALVSAYENGGFTVSGSAGRPPKARKIEPMQWTDGRTFYVGRRENDKFLRGYEKGLQILGPQIEAARRRDPEEFDLGDWVSMDMLVVNEEGTGRVVVRMMDWFRLELELKPKSGDLPEDVIDRRDQYFAGAYPYLGQVLDGVDAEALIIRRERGPRLNLAAKLQAIRQQYGNTLFTACAAYQGDIMAVWDKIVGREHSRDLVRAGVLMVDHG